MSDLKFQVACVGESDEGERFCFGWVRGVERLDDGALEDVGVDLMLKAGDGATVEVEGLGKLVESVVFTREKQAAIGIDLGGSKWWIGCNVDDRKVWRALRSNQEYRLLGVDLKTGEAGELEKSMELRKSNGDGVVEVCKHGLETGNFGTVSKARIEDALETLAKARAERLNISRECAYSDVLSTPEGGILYAALERLPPAA